MSTTAAYWMFRNRMRFVRRWNVWGVPTTFLYSVFKIAKLRRGGHRRAAAAAWRGVTGAPVRGLTRGRRVESEAYGGCDFRVR